MYCVLTVCSANQLRSPTAANVLHSRYGYNTRSAGTENCALIHVRPTLLAWADEVVCMEPMHAEKVREQLRAIGQHIPVYCLDIPDDYEWMQPELVELILERYKKRKVYR